LGRGPAPKRPRLNRPDFPYVYDTESMIEGGKCHMDLPGARGPSGGPISGIACPRVFLPGCRCDLRHSPAGSACVRAVTSAAPGYPRQVRPAKR
jgi:hypothetical protein